MSEEGCSLLFTVWFFRSSWGRLALARRGGTNTVTLPEIYRIDCIPNRDAPRLSYR